jgi:hypothetical protein
LESQTRRRSATCLWRAPPCEPAARTGCIKGVAERGCVTGEGCFKNGEMQPDEGGGFCAECGRMNVKIHIDLWTHRRYHGECRSIQGTPDHDMC